MSGFLRYLDSSLLSLSPEREPGEKQQPGHSQSRQIVGVPGVQGKDKSERIIHTTHTNTPACKAHFVAFACASMNKCHFTLKDENFTVKENNSNLTI